MINKTKYFLKSNLFKNSSIYFIVTFMGKIIPFIIIPLMTVYLTPKEYGIAATYQMYVVLFGLIIGFELNRYLDVYYFKVPKEEFKKYLSTILSVVLLSSLAVFGITTIVMNFITVPSISFFWIATIPLIIMFKFTFMINDGLLRNEENPIAYGKYTITETLISSLVALGLAYFLHSWTSKAYSFIVAMIVLGGFSYFRLKKEYDIKFYINRDILKKAVIFSTPFVFGLNLANIIYANSDKVILLHFYDYTVVGVFAIALVFASITGFVTDSFMKAWVPIFYKKLKNNDKKVDKQSFYIFIGLGIVSLFTIYILTIIMPYMIDAKYYDALDIMPYIAVAYILRVGDQLLLQYINYYEKTFVLYAIIIIAIMSCIVFAYFFVDIYGIIGMAFAINLFYILLIAYYFYIFKNLKR